MSRNEADEAATTGDPSAESVAAASVTAADALADFISVMENTPGQALFSFDTQRKVRFWSSGCAELLGIAASEAVGHSLPDLIQHPGKEEQFAAIVQQLLDTGKPAPAAEWQIATRAGKVLRVHSTMLPVSRGGIVTEVVCLDVDITQHELHGAPESPVSDATFRDLFEKSADAIVLIKRGKYIDANPAALALFGLRDKDQLISRSLGDSSPPLQPDGEPSAQKAQANIALAMQNGNYRCEWQLLGADGKPFWCEILTIAVKAGSDPLLVSVVRDISVRKRAEQSLHLAAQVFESSRDAILIADRNKLILSVNAAFTTISGYQPADVIGQRPPVFGKDVHQMELEQTIWDQIDVTGHWEGELLGLRKNGAIYPEWLSITAVRNQRQQVSNYIAIFSDISERKRSEAQTRHIAEHDALTGLPNRLLLLDRLGQAIGAAERTGGQLALLFLDLDRFKSINDTMGHAIGDKLLLVVAERLQQCVRSVDTVSRQGGDEFVILLINPGGQAHAAHIAANILRSMAMPCKIEHYEIVITTSIGITVYPGDGKDMDTLIKNADIAMYHAKESGRNRYQFFNDDMNMRIVERTSMENHLKQALAQGDFFLEYQPEIDIASGRIIGAEALLRWHHPELGLLSPAYFIPIAEDCGLASTIGDWVLQAACRQARIWVDDGMPMVVSVNLSRAQFSQNNLWRSVVDVLQQTGLDPQYLELEITEDILMGTDDRRVETMKELRKLGVKLALDDFGTGFSSLSHLKRFSIDKLKIDQSFVHDINDDPDDAAIISAIIAMAKNLDLKVIAEGVETAAQLDFLHARGCDEYQGYYSSRSLSPQNLARLRAPINGQSLRH